jgi:hypothetical protein
MKNPVKKRGRPRKTPVDTIPVDSLIKAKQFAIANGGIEKAKQALAAVEKIFSA